MGNKEMKHSYITDCLIISREGNRQPIFSEGGNICVNLRGYAIVPLKEYEAFRAIAEAEAGRIARQIVVGLGTTEGAKG